jgi:hypothetical protein
MFATDFTAGTTRVRRLSPSRAHSNHNHRPPAGASGPDEPGNTLHRPRVTGI